MRFLARERTLLDELLPGLDSRLREAGLSTLEKEGGPGLGWFKEAGGPGLLVPAPYGGSGCSAVDAIRVQRAIGSRSPSLAVATTMHHFSVASLVHALAAEEGVGWMLLDAIARDRLLVASGFSEGVPNRSILSPVMNAVPRDGKLLVSGSKKPCSLSRSMNVLTASVTIAREGGDPELAVALIPATGPGIEVRPFWRNPVLAGAESEEIVLTDVEVPRDLVVPTRTDGGRLDHLQLVGFIWFELLIASSYVGAASTLVERALAAGRADGDLVFRLEAAMSGLEGIALDAAELLAAPSRGDATSPGSLPWQRSPATAGESILARTLACRYAAQDAVEVTAARAVEALGGIAFATSDDVSYLVAASQALKFHPPARSRMARPLGEFYRAGTALTIN